MRGIMLFYHDAERGASRGANASLARGRKDVGRWPPGKATEFRWLRRGIPGEVGHELFDPLMVEEDRHAARPEEDRHSVAEDQRPRMVDSEPRAAPQNDREGPERRTLLERGEGLVEMVLGHRRRPPRRTRQYPHPTAPASDCTAPKLAPRSRVAVWFARRHSKASLCARNTSRTKLEIAPMRGTMRHGFHIARLFGRPKVDLSRHA